MVPNFSDAQLQLLCENADVIACECPAYLVEILRKVRKFRSYTSDCIEQVPEEAETHYWLSDQILEVETLLGRILYDFMQREQLLDEQEHFNLEQLAQRNRQAALRQHLSTHEAIANPERQN